MHRPPHTRFRKGKRLLVVLRSGASFVDIYEERRSGVVIFRQRGRVPVEQIRTITYPKDFSAG